MQRGQVPHRGGRLSPWTFTHWPHLRSFPRFATRWRCPPKVRAADSSLPQSAFKEPELIPPPLALLSAVCLLQVDEGPCRGDIERYYYNTITQKCELFSYGGCQGNANNFKSYQECQKTCFRIPSKCPQRGIRPSSPSDLVVSLRGGSLLLLMCSIYGVFTVINQVFRAFERQETLEDASLVFSHFCPPLLTLFRFKYRITLGGKGTINII